ncbi:MAG: hypothetical protein WD267_03010 [Balneolales bacterium]
MPYLRHGLCGVHFVFYKYFVPNGTGDWKGRIANLLDKIDKIGTNDVAWISHLHVP